MNINGTIESIFNDSFSSDWVKFALRSALARDPIDAANDAELLSMILTTRAHEILEQATESLDCVPL